MNSPTFSSDEVAATLAQHPGLALTAAGDVEGSLDVHAVFNGHEIKDRFDIRITKSNPGPSSLPALYEVGGRTQGIARKWALRDIRNLHRNPQGHACVCVPQEEASRFPAGSDLSVFIDNLCRDYLFGLSFFDAHGRWPWGERSHGPLGLLEFYADTTEQLTASSVDAVIMSFAADPKWREYHRQFRRPSAQRFCICGSRRPFQTCHPAAWRGLLYFTSELRRLGVNARGIFNRARSKQLAHERSPRLSSSSASAAYGDSDTR